MDTHFVWNAILTIGMTIIGALVGLGAKYLAQIQKNLEDRLDNQDEQILQVHQNNDLVQKELSNFKVHVQREFVNQEEYIRTTQSLDSKIDRVLVEINKINVNVARIATTQEVKQIDVSKCKTARG